jgi:5-carboxymethyl-2-hydroxymuconate isomerase
VHDDASKRGNGRDAVARAVHAHLSNDGFFDLGAVETRQIISIAYAYVVDVALAAG